MYDLATVQEADYYDEMNLVVQELLKGNTNYTKLAKQLGMPRKKVLEYVEAWQAVAQNHEGIRMKAAEAITAMARHYDLIISEMWAVVNDPAVTLQVKANTLKSIADVDAKRQEALQKAGLYDDSALGDQLAEMEEKSEAIKRLLTEIAAKFPQAKFAIMEGLEQIFGTAGSVQSPVEGELIA